MLYAEQEVRRNVAEILERTFQVKNKEEHMTGRNCLHTFSYIWNM